MILPSYRSSADYREILRLLQKASSEGENFVWQTRPDGRVIAPIQLLDIEFVSREVVLHFEKGTSPLNPAMPLYVKLDHRSSVFKIPAFTQGARGDVHFSFPQEVKTLELRQHPRTSVDPARERTISLKPSLGNHRDSSNGLNVRLMDISDYGMGLIVSEQNRAFLKNNRILWVTHLQKEELRYPVLAEVVHISSDPQTRKQKDLKVGLKLSGVIDAESINRFL